MVVTVIPVRALALAVLALALAGCQLRVGVDVAVRRSGGGELAVTVGADEELLVRALESGVDPLAALAEQRQQLADTGWRMTVSAREGGGRQVRLSSGFKDADEFNALIAGLAEALAAPEVRLLEPLTLQVANDRIVLAGAGGLVFTPATAEFGIPAEEAVRLIAQDDAVAYEVRVRLPSRVLDTTAARQERGVLVWSIPPGERVEIHAVGARPRPPRLAIVIASVAALMGIAVAAVTLARRARRAVPDA